MPKQEQKAGATSSAPVRGGGHYLSRAFASWANVVARIAGTPLVFAVAVATVLAWLVSGPYFSFSDTWQLVINTGTTIITFLMVFLIQNSQNRDNAAIQLKLDELIRTSAAQNFYVGIEHLTAEEIEEIKSKCELRAKARAVADEKLREVGLRAGRAADRASGVPD